MCGVLLRSNIKRSCLNPFAVVGDSLSQFAALKRNLQICAQLLDGCSSGLPHLKKKARAVLGMQLKV
jgi:hypothetical protein